MSTTSAEAVSPIRTGDGAWIETLKPSPDSEVPRTVLGVCTGASALGAEPDGRTIFGGAELAFGRGADGAGSADGVRLAADFGSDEGAGFEAVVGGSATAEAVGAGSEASVFFSHAAAAINDAATNVVSSERILTTF